MCMRIFIKKNNIFIFFKRNKSNDSGAHILRNQPIKIPIKKNFCINECPLTKTYYEYLLDFKENILIKPKPRCQSKAYIRKHTNCLLI